MHVLRLILVFHMVSQHPIKNSLPKKNMQNNIDFPKKFPNLFKGFSNESMTPVQPSRRNLPSAGIFPHRIGRGHALCAAHQGLGPRYMMVGLYS